MCNNAFLEAVYLASPVLYNECIKWKEGRISGKKEIEKLTRSLNKYLIRMSSRCTPFGLFSGCAVIHWTNEPTAVAVSSGRISRHTRLDMHYLCALSQQLALLPGIRNNLLYFSNSSAYTIGDELRYVEYIYVNGKRIHQISAVSTSEYLDKVVNAAYNGATVQQLCNWLVEDNITAEEALGFIDELINAQVLVSEMEPAITGKEFLEQLIEVLERINKEQEAATADVLQVLRQVACLLQQLDASEDNDIAPYRKVMELLAMLGVDYDESRLFQTDVIKQVSGNGISVKVQQQLGEALTVLNKLSCFKENPHLQSFIRRFCERYEDREMPLLEVLDSDAGIGYTENSGTSVAPLVDDIVIAGEEKEAQLSWGPLERMLSEKLLQMYTYGRQTIEIMDEDLEGFSASWNNLPPSFAVMFRIISESAHTIYLESVGSSSAANMLGRFAHADPAVNRLVCDITRREQEMDPDFVYAEIIHLPESRTGNILLHPVFRQYEIPYLAKSSLDKEQQIDVQDLYISVKNNRLILRSRRLGKQVIPRLSTAHNYSGNALPVYRFLCDLQLQDKRGGMSFHWGALNAQCRFFPRVTYKNTVLYLAKWRFLQKDIQPLLNLQGKDLQEALHRFRLQWKLPVQVVLADGDNELLIDLTHAATASVWLDTVKNRPRFELREFLNDQQQITDEGGRSYVNQLVAVLGKGIASYEQLKIKHSPPPYDGPAQRHFSPGSDWMYYKLYCGIQSADKILLDAIKPLGEELVESRMVDKWFFIRYSDPDFHLRLRLHLSDINDLGPLSRKVHACLQPYKAAGYIWKIQLDTYTRETGRYGDNTIGLAETLFYHDSVAFTNLLDNTRGDQREEMRWLWGLRAVDELLNCFCFPLRDKYALLDGLREDFGLEFNMDKPLKLQLDSKYRKNKQMIEQVMNASDDQECALRGLVSILGEKSRNIAGVVDEILALDKAGKLQVPVPDLLRSYIHMMINRITITYPRKQEMVMYDFLSRYYKSAMVREKTMIAAG